ncbi:MAG: metal ABC transporter permease [Actinomycetota bacterium]|nr:metal ABC transporter permease [Actinomycetota bacterium]
MPIAFLTDVLSDHTVRVVAVAAATLGIVSGALGTHAVLRRQSLLGDAMSHAALPGIALAFLLTGSRAPFVLVLGAAIAGWIGTLAVTAVVRATRVKYDSALGIVLSVFFGAGLVVLTFVQKRPDASQAGLDKFLFGQAAAVLERDLVVMGALGGLALVAVGVLWKEFKLLTFDADFGATLGFPIRLLDVALTALLVLAIVIGLQIVGVVLMSAMVVAPAAAARQWTDRLGVMMLLAAALGAAAGVTGALVSAETSHLPTGPTIVLCAGALVLVSLLFAPNRGLVWRRLEDRRRRRRLRVEGVLADLYALSGQHGSLEHAHPLTALEVMAPSGDVPRSLDILRARGLAERRHGDEWILTAAGRAEAERQRDGREERG